MQRLLSTHGECDVAVDGEEAIAAVEASLEESEPYDLLCLDIDMPGMDGHAVLKEVRRREEVLKTPLGSGIKVIMTTDHADLKTFLGAFRERCEAYLTNPIDKSELISLVQKLGLIGSKNA